MFTRVIGLMTKLKVTAFTLTKMALNTMDNGKMISNMAWEKKHGQMVLCTMETMSMARSMEEELSYGLMVQNIKDNFKIITLKALANINGLMVDLIMANGRTIKCMAKDSSCGLMEESTKGNILKIKNKVMVPSTGLMVENMLANGEMGNSMVKEPLLQLTGNRETENGTLEREQSGLMNDLEDKVIIYRSNFVYK